jgi:simple sugar transport system ATP-binding protein
MVHQHFMLIPRLSVIENVLLNHTNDRRAKSEKTISFQHTKNVFATLSDLLSLNINKVRENVESIIHEYDINVDPDEKVWRLDVGERQRVEIIKSLTKNVDILILDEPSAVLTPLGVEKLFNILEELMTDGVTILLTTHKLDEIMQIADRVTVLRDGKYIDTVAVGDTSRSDLTSMMIGEDSSLESNDTEKSLGETMLEATGLCAKNDQGKTALSDADLTVRSGEIVGVAGVSGNGQKELAECLTGIRSLTRGEIKIHGDVVSDGGVEKFLDSKVAYIPADRLKKGLVPEMSVVQNLMMDEYTNHSGQFLFDYASAKEQAKKLIEAYDIRVPHPEVPAAKLSGGNQQKIILARELSSGPQMLIANQPTRGLDVGAVEFIRKELIEQSRSGTGIVLISEDLDELIQISDRIVVMYDGEIVYNTSDSDPDIRIISRFMTDGVGNEESSTDSVSTKTSPET